ncbi:MAG: FecR domain-containing protein [Pseudomonadota bacterium]
MSDEEDVTSLLDEAAMIFVQLRETPDDEALLAERDAFLARSPAARRAYRKIENGWRVSGSRRRPSSMLVLALAIGLSAALYLGASPLRTFLVADVSTGVEAERVELGSGDVAHLDAGSAIIDETEIGVRNVRLLEGAALFEVDAETAPFIVSAGDAEVTVRGTIFETALRADGLSIAVAEGTVDVEIANERWSLDEGEQLIWSQGSDAVVIPIDTDSIAAWRGDQLVAEDMAVEEIVEIIDRRVRGEVLVVSGELAATRVSGNFDLSDPQSALRALAAITGARLISGPPVLTVLMATD